MTASTAVQTTGLVRFGRKQTRGVLLGFSGIRLLTLGLGAVWLVLPMFVAGVLGLTVTAPVWLGLFAVAFIPFGGGTLIDSAPLLVHWGARVAAGQTRYLLRASAPRPAGTMALPGDAASLRFHADDVSGAGMVHDPHRGRLTAVAHVTHPAYVLLAPDDQARRVAAWSRVLAGVAATGTCAGVQVLESALPDPGLGVRGWWNEHGVHDDSWASREYATLMAQAAPSSSTHRTLLALSLDLRKAARSVRAAGRGMTGAAAVLRGDMATFEAALSAAELHCEGWLSPQQLAVVIRQAYDPAAVDLTPDSPGADLATAGPVAVVEHWDHLRHDSGYTAVLWLSEWPRIDVAPHFLHALIFQPQVRKSLSILATPLGTGEALRQIRKEKVDYITEASQKAKIGRIADLADDQEYADVLDRERALIAGHADMRFTGFLAVTATGRDGLRSAVSAVERAASQCGCETRLLYGRQAQAFVAAALPLGRAVH